jgi:hypothetical protein
MADYGHELMFGTFLTPTAAQADRVVALAQLTEQVGPDLVTVQDHPCQPAASHTRGPSDLPQAALGRTAAEGGDRAVGAGAPRHPRCARRGRPVIDRLGQRFRRRGVVA